MDDIYISKQEAAKAFQEYHDADVEVFGVEIPECFDAQLAIEIMNEVPAADVRPVKRGHWVKRMEGHTTPKYTSFTPIWSCSECGLEYDPALAPRIHFCYNCGADMREKT